MVSNCTILILKNRIVHFLLDQNFPSIIVTIYHFPTLCVPIPGHLQKVRQFVVFRRCFIADFAEIVPVGQFSVANYTFPPRIAVSSRHPRQKPPPSRIFIILRCTICPMPANISMQADGGQRSATNGAPSNI
jgi:hypothetical protein